MKWNLSVLPVAIAMVFALSACRSDPPPSVEAAPASEPQSIAMTTSMTGEQAYEQQCAGCHETGINGAPVVGDTAYWEHRSRLWQAVIMDHAKTGYLDMPARGGRSDLSDETIELAVEYMLEKTFADIPKD